MQHLRPAVRKIERRAGVDVHLVLPVVRRDHALHLDAALDGLESRAFLDEPEHAPAEGGSFALPVDAGSLVRDGHEHVEGGLARRCERRVRHRCILYVERKIIGRQLLLAEQLANVLAVIIREENRVVRERQFAVEPEIEHEGRAREVELRQAIGAILRQLLGRHEPRHRVTEVGIEYHGICAHSLASAQLDAGGGVAVEGQPLYRSSEMNFGAVLGRDARHGARNLVQPAAHVRDAELLLDERQHREKRWALPRRHAEVLRLERERQDELVVVEVAREIAKDGAAERQLRQRAQQRGREIRCNRAVRPGETRHQRLEAPALLGEEAVVPGLVAGEKGARSRPAFAPDRESRGSHGRGSAACKADRADRASGNPRAAGLRRRRFPATRSPSCRNVGPVSNV